MRIKTKCIHSLGKRYDNTGAISTPIFQSATFAHEGGKNTGYDYSRLQNPTREELETIVCNLENGADAMAFSSGMAALSLLMELFQSGDHIVAGDDLYGGSHRLFDTISNKNGITVQCVDTTNIEAIKNAINPNTKAIFVETISNPLMQVSDIEAIVSVAREKNVLTIVDNTFLTPYFQRPLDLGADIVLHSGTKYLGGHNDTLAGFLVVKDPVLGEQIRFIYKTMGSCLAPFDSWLIIRGIKTLALRLDQQQKNAIAIAEYLHTNSAIEAVFYPGLPSDSGHALLKKQSSGFGAMISFRVKEASIANKILNNVRVMTYAESLGGVETLITYPMVQTHADVPEAIRLAKGIDDKLLRLSVGIEDIHDLLDEFKEILGE